jgi:hypothetical protein
MRLIELEARFLRIVQTSHFETVELLSEAQGILFLCPKCFVENKGPVGTHSVLCWFGNRGVPDGLYPTPGRWIPAGTSLADLTFVGPGAASILLSNPGCGWHGFIKAGNAE